MVTFKHCVAEPSVSEASVAQNKEVGRSLLLRIVVGDRIVELLKKWIDVVVDGVQIVIRNITGITVYKHWLISLFVNPLRISHELYKVLKLNEVEHEVSYEVRIDHNHAGLASRGNLTNLN